jgi:CTP-dependent riboflavin kinase
MIFSNQDRGDMMDGAELSSIQKSFLSDLYESAQGDKRTVVPLEALSQKLGISEEEALEISGQLEQEYYIKLADSVTGVSITEKGITVVESNFLGNG